MKTTLIIAVLLLGWLASTHAQPNGQHRQRPVMPLMKALDADSDGVLNATEIANAATSLKTLDTNSDGTISAAELEPPRPDNAPSGPPPSADAGKRPHPAFPLMTALDTDKDGALSASEIANAPAALKTLDKNNDGQITADEIRPSRPEGSGRGSDDAGGPPPGDE